MSDPKSIIDIVPYPLFPTTSAGRKSILHFNNHLSGFVKAYVGNIGYAQHPPVKFHLAPLFTESKLRYINILILFRLRKLVKQSGADFVLIEHPYMGWLGLLLPLLVKVKWGIRSHNIEYERFRSFNKRWWPLLKKYELYIYSKADAVFFITEDDKRYAEAHCSMKHSYVMPTGMLISALPDDKAACKEILRKTYGLSDDTTILIYNGALDYKPNIEALDAILQYINPYLQQQHFKYKILVCGNGLLDSYNKLEAYRDQNIIFCGFVDDITLYFKGADVYLNPMIGGGGIKTRLVESISYNTNAVSTQNGAIGFMNATVEDKVAVVEDNNWPAFAEAVIAMSKKNTADTTKEFYEYYYWTNIVQRFIKQVNAVIS